LASRDLALNGNKILEHAYMVKKLVLKMLPN
jgi:hypothetical protein